MNIQSLIDKYPQIAALQKMQPIFWRNSDYGKQDPDLKLHQANIFDAVDRWNRFAPYLEQVFPETISSHGIIESPLIQMDQMKKQWNQEHLDQLNGQLYLKADNELPVSGSIKSRGGIYEVLKFAEQIAMTKGDLVYMDDYRILNTPKYKQLFAQYGVSVASTGNLALSVGIMAATFGFKTTVYMSHDAKQWKKDKLRNYGVNVKEYNTNFSAVVTKARNESAQDPTVHFIDDEGSVDLFLGYAVSAVRLQKKLKDQKIKVDANHPVIVYLPAGVGGSPGGTTFGLKNIIGPHIHAVFCEPTHVPSVTLGMMTKLYNHISVYDLGLDGLTQADGLAVGRSSRIAGKILRTLLFGSVTFPDDIIFKYLTQLKDTQNIKVEPSAAAGLTGIKSIIHNVPKFNVPGATHIVWATGGDIMPDAEFKLDYDKGKHLIETQSK